MPHRRVARRPTRVDARTTNGTKTICDAEKAEVSYWYAKLDWYTAFRKVGLVPSFAGAAKQARMA